MLNKIKDIATNTGSSLAALLKVALMSKRPSPRGDNRGESLVVMGNGPSLRETIDNHRKLLDQNRLMSVNFAPLTQEFFSLKPGFHVLADGLFFEKTMKGNVEEMWDALKRVEWGMVLYVPAKYRNSVLKKELPENVKVKYFNMTPASGWGWLTNLLYRSGLAMPRPRNVLVPAIMNGIREGFERIILVGADHSWSKTLWVTDNNIVVSVQPHFYKDNEKERERVESLYKGIRLYQIYESFAIAFRSYFALSDYAQRRGVEIINATPGSFIDAFRRSQPEKLIRCD